MKSITRLLSRERTIAGCFEYSATLRVNKRQFQSVCPDTRKGYHQYMTEEPKPQHEFLQTAQSFTFDIKNVHDGKFAIMTFFALPNGAANPQNQMLARFALPYEGFAAIPGFIQELIAQNNAKFPPKS